MPAPVRRLLVYAAGDGLVLWPSSRPGARAGPVRIDHAGNVRPLLREPPDNWRAAALEVHGVVGLLRVAGSAYLVCISRRRQVALLGRPVYVVTGIAIIPAASQGAAAAAIHEARAEGHAEDEAGSGSSASSDSGSDWASDSDGPSDVDSVDAGMSASYDRQPGIAEEVLHGQGFYGRFANRWFSRRGVSAMRASGGGGPGGLGDDDHGPLSRLQHDKPAAGDPYQRWPQTPVTDKEDTPAADETDATDSLASSLLPKLLRTTKLLLTSRTFYFAYEHDLTRSLASQNGKASDLPLHRQVDPLYFWNAHLAEPIISAGHGDYIMPIMQGFVGQRRFSVTTGENGTVEGTTESTSPETSQDDAQHESQDYLLTLISRRSTCRAGLRYLRRGIDEDGNVANAVETEQILSMPSWSSKDKIFSFVQTRGSIPLFFSQMPYQFKPPPTLHASAEVNQAALRKHFGSLASKYGRVHAVSLVDRHAPEKQIGDAYEAAVRTLNGQRDVAIDFDWFEFHQACRGMRFENVSILVDMMRPTLHKSGFAVLEPSGTVTKQQGIIRSNCMDCLDRTNVVQSAFGQYVLSQQLAASGIQVDLLSDPSTIWFNSLWADNGDAISRAYTGTSALKGDYTRTRKRNALGALTDLSLTLSRYYYNLFNDFFAQAAIDYLLGSVGESVFVDFEATMNTADPAIDLWRARQDAIDTAANVVIEQDEDLLHGWATKIPAEPASLRTLPFHEVLLLCSDKALYVVEFDWDANKVQSSERIGFESLTSIRHGVYIIETHTKAQTDAASNAGILVRYNVPSAESYFGTAHPLAASMSSLASAAKDDGPPATPGRVIRLNTRTVENWRLDAWAGGHSDDHAGDGPASLLAFKVLPARPARGHDRRASTGSALGAPGLGKPPTEAATAAAMAQQIQQAAAGAGVALELQHADILSLADARRQTGIVESLAYTVKRAIWG